MAAAWGLEAAAGKGSKGKGKGSKTGGKGHTLPRTRITAEKFTGAVTDWKGKYGWIKADEEIPHEKSSMNGGKLFVSKDDIIGLEELGIGAQVEFHICEDSSGLGAEEVVQLSPGKAAGKAGGKAKGKVAGKSWSDGKSWSEGKSWSDGGAAKGAAAKGGYGGKGAKGYGAGAGGLGGLLGVLASQLLGGGAKGAKGFKGKDKGKGKGKGKGGKGHLLPRTRVTAEKFTGTVAAWKGKYGWITPSEEVEHEKAKNHKGGIFVSRDDLEGVTELAEGATVEFHIWEDADGLGAEEVVQY